MSVAGLKGSAKYWLCMVVIADGETRLRAAGPDHSDLV